MSSPGHSSSGSSIMTTLWRCNIAVLSVGQEETRGVLLDLGPQMAEAARQQAQFSEHGGKLRVSGTDEIVEGMPILLEQLVEGRFRRLEAGACLANLPHGLIGILTQLPAIFLQLET